MHGIGSLAGADNGLAGFDLEPFAAADQFRGVLIGAEDAAEPAAQIRFFLRAVLMLMNDLVLAPFQRMIEFGDDRDVFADELA